MCMIDDCDKADLWNETRRKARKEYKCSECHRTIEPGETYVYLFGKGDGSVFIGRWCAHCDVAKEWLWDNCHGSILEQVIEDIAEHVESYRGEAACVPRLQRLVVGAHRKWRIEYGPKKGQLMPIPMLPVELEPKHHSHY